MRGGRSSAFASAGAQMATTPAKQPMRSRYAESAESDLDKMLNGAPAASAPTASQSSAGAESAAAYPGIAAPTHSTVLNMRLGETLSLDMLNTPPAPQKHPGGGFGPGRTSTRPSPYRRPRPRPEDTHTLSSPSASITLSTAAPSSSAADKTRASWASAYDINLGLGLGHGPGQGAVQGAGVGRGHGRVKGAGDSGRGTRATNEPANLAAASRSARPVPSAPPSPSAVGGMPGVGLGLKRKGANSARSPLGTRNGGNGAPTSGSTVNELAARRMEQLKKRRFDEQRAQREARLMEAEDVRSLMLSRHWYGLRAQEYSGELFGERLRARVAARGAEDSSHRQQIRGLHEGAASVARAAPLDPHDVDAIKADTRATLLGTTCTTSVTSTEDTGTAVDKNLGTATETREQAEARVRREVEEQVRREVNEANAKREEEARFRREVEEQVRREVNEANAKREQEARVRREVEEQVRREVNEANAKREEEARVRREVEEQVRREANEANAKREEEARVRREVEEQVRKEASAKENASQPESARALALRSSETREQIEGQIADCNRRKKASKEVIKKWLSSFKEKNGRDPSIEDKKGVEHMYLEYQKLQTELKRLQAKATELSQGIEVVPEEPQQPVTETETEAPAKPSVDLSAQERDFEAAKAAVKEAQCVKRDAKEAVKAWAKNFEEQNGRAPNTEDKEQARNLYVAYKQASEHAEAAMQQAKDAGMALKAAAAAAEGAIPPPPSGSEWDECLDSAFPSSAHAAAYKGHYQCLQYLCDYYEVFALDEENRTALFYAAISNQEQCMQLLLERGGAEWMGFYDNRGDTPLHAAAANGSCATLRLLLQWGADPNAANYQGFTPAHISLSKEGLIALHQHGADLFAADASGCTPLFMACTNGVVEMASLLIELDKEAAQTCDVHGDSPLHTAVRNGHAHIVQLLLERCNELLHKENGDGCSPTLLAHNRGQRDIAQLLSQWGGVTHSQQATALTQLSAPRWEMLYDEQQKAYYYFDNEKGSSVWERPEGFDGIDISQANQQPQP